MFSNMIQTRRILPTLKIVSTEAKRKKGPSRSKRRNLSIGVIKLMREAKIISKATPSETIKKKNNKKEEDIKQMIPISREIAESMRKTDRRLRWITEVIKTKKKIRRNLNIIMSQDIKIKIRLENNNK